MGKLKIKDGKVYHYLNLSKLPSLSYRKQQFTADEIREAIESIYVQSTSNVWWTYKATLVRDRSVSFYIRESQIAVKKETIVRRKLKRYEENKKRQGKYNKLCVVHGEMGSICESIGLNLRIYGRFLDTNVENLQALNRVLLKAISNKEFEVVRPENILGLMKLSNK